MIPILSTPVKRIGTTLIGSTARPILLRRSFASAAKKQPRQLDDRPVWTKLTNLLRGIDAFLHKQKDPAVIDQYIHGRLDKILLKTTSPHEVYQRVISHFIKRQRVQDAVHVYRRMLDENVIPTPHTQAEMAAVTLASDPDTDLQPLLDAIAADPAFTDDHLLHLLWVSVELGASYDHLLHFASVFIESRGDQYIPNRSVLDRLLEAQTRAGRLEEAFATALMYESEEGESRSKPYESIISDLKRTNITDTDSFNKVLLEMKSHNISPNINIFNHLISRELRLNSISGAFAFYRLILEVSKSSSTSPNAGTFGPLFGALANSFSFDMHGCRMRVLKHPIDVTLPRQLFHDMLSFYSRGTFPVDTVLLNTVLRAFIQSGDYAGAFVALNAFRVFKQSPSGKTYRVVIRYLARRARGDLHLGLEWGHRFMGIEKGSFKKRHQIDDQFAEKIVASACCPSFHLTGDLFVHLKEQNLKPKYHAPTVAMMEGKEIVPERTTFDLVPLLRILRRAALADLYVGEGYDQDAAPSIRVSRVIVEAKAAMIPGQEHRSHNTN